MSTILNATPQRASTAPATSATRTGGRTGTSRPSPRHPFPVGARFPHRSAAAEGDTYRPQLAIAPTAAVVFPVGARFWRPTQSDILAYLADVELGRRVPARRSHPVGARFPRRPR